MPNHHLIPLFNPLPSFVFLHSSYHGCFITLIIYFLICLLAVSHHNEGRVFAPSCIPNAKAMSSIILNKCPCPSPLSAPPAAARGVLPLALQLYYWPKP